MYSPLHTVLDRSPEPHGLSRPVSTELDHVQVCVWQVDAEASQPLDSDVALTQVRETHASDDGVILGEDGVREICRDGGVVVVEVDHDGRHILLTAKGRGQARELRLARDNGVRLVLEVANGVSSALADADSRHPEITTAKVRELAPHPSGHADPAIDFWLRQGHGLVCRAAEVVSDQVTSSIVDVEAVRDLVAVEGEVCAINRDAWRYLVFRSRIHDVGGIIHVCLT